ncbi:MAG: GNAT family N-acetyltransferase [Rudaea sp.]
MKQNLAKRPPYTIRETRIEDAARLPDIERSAGEAFRAIPALAWLADGEDHPESTHVAHIDAGTSWVAVDTADSPIGFLIGDLAGDDFYIVEFSVRLDRQGAGCGKALLSHVAQWARTRGIRSILLSTFREVPWNAPFYRRMGFREIEWKGLGDLVSGALERENAIGLPREMRCAMRWSCLDSAPK